MSQPQPQPRHTFVLRTDTTGDHVTITNVGSDQRAQLASLEGVAEQLKRWLAEARSDPAGHHHSDQNPR